MMMLLLLLLELAQTKYNVHTTLNRERRRKIVTNQLVNRNGGRNMDVESLPAVMVRTFTEDPSVAGAKWRNQARGSWSFTIFLMLVVSATFTRCSNKSRHRRMPSNSSGSHGCFFFLLGRHSKFVSRTVEFIYPPLEQQKIYLSI